MPKEYIEIIWSLKSGVRFSCFGIITGSKVLQIAAPVRNLCHGEPNCVIIISYDGFGCVTVSAVAGIITGIVIFLVAQMFVHFGIKSL